MGLHILIFSRQLPESRLDFFDYWIDERCSLICRHRCRGIALRFKQTTP